jgi:hypothetical protein
MVKLFSKVVGVSIFFTGYALNASTTDTCSKIELVSYVPRVAVGIVYLMPLIYLLALQKKDARDNENIIMKMKNTDEWYNAVFNISNEISVPKVIDIKDFESNILLQEKKIIKQQEYELKIKADSNALLNEFDQLALATREETKTLRIMHELIVQLKKKIALKK